MKHTRALLFGVVALSASARKVNSDAFAEEVASYLWRRLRAENLFPHSPAHPADGEPALAVRELVDCAMEHSLSSAGEDLFTLPTLLSLAGGAPGVFVELGAYDGIQGSNTYMLERCLNWSGLLIEANPWTFKLLQQSGRRAPTVHGAVCADVPGGGHISFQDPTVTSGMGSKQSLETRWVEKGMIFVPCKSLTAHMSDHGIRHAHVRLGLPFSRLPSPFLPLLTPAPSVASHACHRPRR
jgi:hypothetical protein